MSSDACDHVCLKIVFEMAIRSFLTMPAVRLSREEAIFDKITTDSIFDREQLIASIESVINEETVSALTNDDESSDEVFNVSRKSSLAEPMRVVGSKVSSTYSSICSSNSSRSSSASSYRRNQSSRGEETSFPKRLPSDVSSEMVSTGVSSENNKENSVARAKSGAGSAAMKLKKNPVKYKTELCESYAKGLCLFGYDCQFAHGMSELRPVMVHQKYKTVKCKYFYNGFCNYGNRCAFIHDVNSKAEKMMVSQLLKTKYLQKLDKNV